jgi:hypothetical protein
MNEKIASCFVLVQRNYHASECLCHYCEDYFHPSGSCLSNDPGKVASDDLHLRESLPRQLVTLVHYDYRWRA